MEKRGQVALFIILGVVVVAGISVVVLMFTNQIPNIATPSGTTDAERFLAQCIGQKINPEISNLTLNGGAFQHPLNLTFQFDPNQDPVVVPYLCYTSEASMTPCINQNPFIVESFTANLKKSMEQHQDVEGCFNDLVASLKTQGYEVTEKYNDFNLNINYSSISVNVDAQLTLTKGSTERYNKFKIIIPMDKYGIYNLLWTVQDILNSEATGCGIFTDYTTAYPNFKVNDIIDTIDKSTIFVVSDKANRYTFRFATRGCLANR